MAGRHDPQLAPLQVDLADDAGDEHRVGPGLPDESTTGDTPETNDCLLDSADTECDIDAGGQTGGQAHFLAPDGAKARQRECQRIGPDRERVDPILPCSSVTASRTPCRDGLVTVTVTPGSIA